MTFTSYHGLQKFLQIPLGLKNALSTLQRAMDIILSTVKLQIALFYMHDVFIILQSIEENLDHIQTTLGLLFRAGLSLKLKKRILFEDCIDRFGHII